jgi:chemotaxis protein CheD
MRGGARGEPRAGAAAPLQVGIGEAAWLVGAGVIATVGLGSCVGVAVFDPVARVGGLLHFQLADGAADPARAQAQPFLFGDTGLRALTSCLGRAGAVPARSRVHVVGGAQMMAAVSGAQIGKRNVLAARKHLWSLGYLIEGEVVGGNVSRSLALDVAHGEVEIREYGRNT